VGTVIDNDGAARRLARAIVSDIRLYNEEKVRAGSDLSEAIAEGRELFHERVAPEHHRVFDEEWAAISGAPPPPRAAAPAAAEERFGTFYATAGPAPSRRGSSALLVACALVAVVVAVGVWILAF
jgi:hypothetical protein